MAKLTRKEIKAPDEFLAATQRFWDLVMEHRRPLGLATAAVLGVGLAVAGVSWALERRQHEHGEALFRALDAASKPVVTASTPSASPPEQREFYDSEDERLRISREALQKAIDAGPTGAAGLTATLRLAKLVGDAGRHDEASKLYEQWLARAPTDASERLFALEGLGYATEAQGDLAGARAAFERLSTEAGSPERAAFQAARLLEKEGKKEEAEKAYRRIAQEFESHAVATESQTRLDLMAALSAPPNPPEPPAPAPKAPRKKGAR